jgi:hypothetical protein
MNERMVASHMSATEWIRYLSRKGGRVDAAIHVDRPSLQSQSGKKGGVHGCGRCSCSASGFQATWG